MKRPRYFPRTLEGDTLLAIEIRAVHEEIPGYGTRRIHEALADRGIRTSRKRVMRLMKDRKLAGASEAPRPEPIDYSPRLVRRRTIPPGVGLIWVGDTTQFMTRDGWLYLTVWLDLRSRFLVGWALSDRNDAALAVAALANGIHSRNPARGLVVHSDRGVQFTAAAFRAILEMHAFEQSMSRRGNCHDNAWVESFFAGFKRETKIRTMKREARATVRARAFEYLATHYNQRRKHSSLGGHTPAAFERLPAALQDRILIETAKRAAKVRRARLRRLKRKARRSR